MAKKSALNKLNNSPNNITASESTRSDITITAYTSLEQPDSTEDCQPITTPTSTEKNTKKKRRKRKITALSKLKHFEGVSIQTESISLGDYSTSTASPSVENRDNTPTDTVSPSPCPTETPPQVPTPENAFAHREVADMPPTNGAAPNNPIDYNDFETDLDAEDIKRGRKERKAAKRKAVLSKICLIVMLFACAYLLLLIYGVLKTEYTYDETGKVVAQRMSYEQLKASEDFKTVYNEYLQTRRLYEEVLKLDYRLAAGVEDPLLIAPDYEEILEQVDALTIQIKELSGDIADTRYTQVQEMLEEWVSTQIAVYCQNMSKAISRNDTEAASHALQYKNVAYNGFTIITENLLAIGSQVEGADLSELKSWSPEKFINDHIDGMGGAS